MTGGVEDMVLRIKALLPERWFGEKSPILDAVLTGPAEAWSWLYGVVRSASLQLRFRSATGLWLEALAADFFAAAMRRRVDELDEVFRQRLLQGLLRERGTRQAMRQALIDLTGREPILFEPAHSGDTGAYGAAGMSTGSGLAYGSAGGWGSLLHPFQLFITARRPIGAGSAGSVGWGAGGYNLGRIAYVDLDAIRGRITDKDINDTVNGTIPIGTTGWVRITG